MSPVSLSATGTHVPHGRASRMLQRGSDPRLHPIARKVHEGQRLSLEEGMALYETPDIWTVCALADSVRRRLHGDIAYYNINRHLNYSNICALSCKFCAFYRKKDEDGAYEYSLEQIREEAIKAWANGAGATEMHIVGGLHPWLKFDYYTDMLRTIREVAPALHIKAFTAVEIVHLAKISKRGRDGYEGIKAVLRDLQEAGLGSLPGGGAEVFDDRVHDEAFKGKIRSDQWLDVHRAAHELNLNTNATMLYGHIEQRRERLWHMEMLRRAQDVALERVRTEGVGGRFQTIIPLPFFPDESELEHLPAPTGLENLRTLAISRLMLDNFPHVKAFWIMQGLPMAQFMLQNGADDIDGTVVWYDITKLDHTGSGASTHQEVGPWDLQKAIREAGFTPVERDTVYRRVDRDAQTGAWRVVR